MLARGCNPWRDHGRTRAEDERPGSQRNREPGRSHLEGRFKAVGINWGLRRRYELFVDGQSLGISRVWFPGTWTILALWTLVGSLTYFGMSLMTEVLLNTH